MTVSEIIARLNEVECFVLDRVTVRNLDTEVTDETLEILDEVQGAAGDDGIAVIIVTGKALP